jgi:hypothetical protein
MPLISIIGIVYGGFALVMWGRSTSFYSKGAEMGLADLQAEIERGGSWGIVCRIALPLFWIVTLPYRNILAALAVAAGLFYLGQIL